MLAAKTEISSTVFLFTSIFKIRYSIFEIIKFPFLTQDFCRAGGDLFYKAITANPDLPIIDRILQVLFQLLRASFLHPL